MKGASEALGDRRSKNSTTIQNPGGAMQKPVSMESKVAKIV